MYNAPLPLPILAIAAVAFICYLSKTAPKKKHRYKLNKYIKVPKTDPKRVRSVIDSHSDCISVIENICSWDPERTAVTMRHSPGDPVSLRFANGALSVFIDDTYIDKVFNSKLNSIVSAGKEYEAYIYERDMAASSPRYMDFLSVIVFYKD